jgi:sulfonate transport system substrate-binding protein
MKKLLPLLCLAGILALLSASCKGSDKPLTLVYSHKVCYEPMMIALEKGFFEDQGVEVDVKLVVGGIQAAEAMATGSGDVAAMGDAPALILTGKNPGLRIIARYGGGEKMHRLIARTGISEPQALPGKKVGIQKGSSTHGGFLLWADANGIDLSMVNLIPLNPLDMPEALATGQVDAIAGSEPWPTNVLNYAGDQAGELADFSGLGHSFPLVLVASERIIESRREDLVALFKAIDAANEMINSDASSMAALTAEKIGISITDEERCLGNLFWEIGYTQSDEQSLMLTADFLLQFGKLEQKPDLGSVVDLSILEGMNGSGI